MLAGSICYHILLLLHRRATSSCPAKAGGVGFLGMLLRSMRSRPIVRRGEKRQWVICPCVFVHLEGWPCSYPRLTCNSVGHPKVLLFARVHTTAPANTSQGHAGGAKPQERFGFFYFLFCLYPHPCAAVLLLVFAYMFIAGTAQPVPSSRRSFFSVTWRYKLSTFHC